MARLLRPLRHCPRHYRLTAGLQPISGPTQDSERVYECMGHLCRRGRYVVKQLRDRVQQGPARVDVMGIT